MARKKQLPKGLVEHQIVKPRRDITKREDAGKQFLTNLIYMVPLHKVLGMIIPFYWNPDKDIIDTTAGKKISWETFPYNHKGFDGVIPWRVDFNDIEPDADAEFHLPAQKINEIGRHYDILFNDFPFTDLKNGLESFGTKKRIDRIRKEKSLGRREEYFRKFRPLDQVFPECVDAWNKTAASLIIKIGDSHKEYHLLPNHVHAINTFDHSMNPKSEFHLLDCIHYRGIYSSRGGRFPFAQSVTSYYLIFKKNLKAR
ncbi:MAG: hypothetical protein AABY15_04025 [Nanoarchaeota archaeon]